MTPIGEGTNSGAAAVVYAIAFMAIALGSLSVLLMVADMRRRMRARRRTREILERPAEELRSEWLSNPGSSSVGEIEVDSLDLETMRKLMRILEEEEKS